MKDGYYEPMVAVWNNLAMAEVFTHLVRQGGVSYINLEWLLSGAASGLWNAGVIFNDRVAEESERLEPSAHRWFLDNERLVHQLRNGQAHFSQEQGVTHAVQHHPGELPKSFVFVWLGSDFDGNHDEIIPVDDAVSRLDAIRAVIEEHVSAVTGQGKFHVYLPTGRLVEADASPT